MAQDGEAATLQILVRLRLAPNLPPLRLRLPLVALPALKMGKGSGGTRCSLRPLAPRAAPLVHCCQRSKWPLSKSVDLTATGLGESANYMSVE